MGSRYINNGDDALYFEHAAKGGVAMFYEYAVYPDGLHTSFTERMPDGSYYFIFEWPLPYDMGMARCHVPSMDWDRLHKAGLKKLREFETFIAENREIIEDCVDQVTEEAALERAGLVHA